MRFCSFLNEPNIPVRDLPFAEAWRQLLDYEEQLDWPEECKGCKAANACFKCIAAVSGSGGTRNVNGVPCRVVRDAVQTTREDYNS